jgi:hypothetical protein
MSVFLIGLFGGEIFDEEYTRKDTIKTRKNIGFYWNLANSGCKVAR